MTLAARLQAAIRDLHSRIELLPIAQAMAHGTIGRQEYGRLLSQLRFAHRALEAVLPEQPALESVYHPSMARATDLLTDLAALGLLGAAQRVLPQTRSFAEEVAGPWAKSPASLVGCLYVLEGSRMGSMILAPRLAKAFGVPMLLGHGLDYHIRDLECRPLLWRQFKTALEGLPFSEQQADTLVRAAERTMEHLYNIYAAVSDFPQTKPLPRRQEVLV
ncbi:MAG: biliverdin-producing heme oxygenase [Gemmataceae bacterium]